ncbi:MAG: efflux transporter outer membrane subunit [Gammaproteobacteria bacterium]|nr:MAG: efflux transporter outer membrane subunit [Gammaproteobacteria bacterium]TLZ42389.1 MAG: efflux transporter outer membrane subunit [Gammaproteobacteria bacterium]
MRRALRCIPALLALGAAGGCGYLPIGPTYHRPSLEVPPAYKESKDWKPAEPQDLTSRGEWWELYGDADLDALERQVQVSNQNVLLAAARYEQAAALLGTARSGYFPTITADVSSTRSKNTTTAGGGASTAAAGNAVRTQDRVSLATVWELDVWGRVRRTVESNRESAQASAGDLAAMLLSEQATLAQSYFQLRVTDLDLGLLERSMAAYEKALEVTRNRYQAGVAQRYDVTQAQTQLENVRAQHVDLGITRATLEHAIAVLVGRPPAALSIPRKEQAPAIPAIPLTLPSQLLERRPDIAAAERRAAAANAQIGIARAAWFPTLSLGGSEGYASSGFSGLFQVPNRFWSLGPDLVGTLVDFGARRYQVRAASASYDQSVATYRQTVLTAFQEVEDNLAALKMLAEESTAERAAADAAAETLAIVENQYKAGTVDYLNVVSAQNASLGAERAWRDITNRSLAASVGLLKALGGGWRSDALPLN